MSLIMGQIEPEHPKLFALELKKIAESDFVYTLASTNIHQASTNIHQSAPNLVKMYLIIRSWMSLSMDLIGPELSKLFALEFERIAESDLIYTLAFTNVDQLVPNMVTICMTITSWMSFVIGQIWQ